MELERPFRNASLMLNEPRAVYYAGQLLTGHLECNLNVPVDLTAINVNFHGEAKVRWTESESQEYNGIRSNKEVVYQGSEEYFNTTQCIYGGEYVSQLPPGSHSFFFQYQIPYKVPSSFTGSRGHVKYTVTAYIDFSDKNEERDEVVKEFEVVAPMDLNEAKAPAEVKFEEIFSCCCNFTSLDVLIKMPASGYCPGQSIPLTIIAGNKSNVEVRRIIFQLLQCQTFRSQHPPSEYTPPDEVLQTIKTGPILANTKREMIYQLVVPDMIAPNMDNCDIIDFGFSLKVTMKLSGCNNDIDDETEICIGLVPLPGTPGAEEYKHPMAHSLPQAPLPPPPPPTEPNTIPAAYPNTNSSYPAVNPYATGFMSNSPYASRENVPMPGAPNQNIGFVIRGPPEYSTYSGGDASYQGANVPYQGANVPYPGANVPYPSSNVPYQGANISYQGANESYPGSNVPYSGINLPHLHNASAPPN